MIIEITLGFLIVICFYKLNKELNRNIFIYDKKDHDWKQSMIEHLVHLIFWIVVVYIIHNFSAELEKDIWNEKTQL